MKLRYLIGGGVFADVLVVSRAGWVGAFIGGMVNPALILLCHSSQSLIALSRTIWIFILYK